METKRKKIKNRSKNDNQLPKSPQKLKQLYSLAQKNSDVDLLNNISQTEVIESVFNFLGEFFLINRAHGNYHLLPLPIFSTENKSFKDLVKFLTLEKFKNGHLKKFGLLTEKFGVVFLNNFYFLKNIYPPGSLNIDQVLNLDHSRQLDHGVIDLIDEFTFDFFFKKYSLKRTMNLLLNTHEMEIDDTYRMVDQNPDYREIMEILPKKPKSFREIHDAVSGKVITNNQLNLPLNQSIQFLNGEKVGDFIIEVPRSTKNLIDTSRDLSHCVHSYTKLVINGECQILNLLKNGKRIYTVEIIISKESPLIRQFKGSHNESSMEGFEGEEIRQKICRLIIQRSKNFEQGSQFKD